MRRIKPKGPAWVCPQVLTYSAVSSLARPRFARSRSFVDDLPNRLGTTNHKVNYATCCHPKGIAQRREQLSTPNILQWVHRERIYLEYLVGTGYSGKTTLGIVWGQPTIRYITLPAVVPRKLHSDKSSYRHQTTWRGCTGSTST